MAILGTLPLEAPVVSVTGSGGKSTLLAVLGRELAARGETCVLATTTFFSQVPGIPLVAGDADEVRRALARHGVIYVGEPVPGRPGKLAPARTPLAELARTADRVLVEADGSHRLPFKAHAAHEPVIAAESGQEVLVVGASGFDRAVEDVVHRPELACPRMGCAPGDPAAPELVARLLARELELGLVSPGTVVVNQVEDARARRDARAFAAELARRCGDAGAPRPRVLAGSIRAGALAEV